MLERQNHLAGKFLAERIEFSFPRYGQKIAGPEVEDTLLDVRSRLASRSLSGRESGCDGRGHLWRRARQNPAIEVWSLYRSTSWQTVSSLQTAHSSPRAKVGNKATQSIHYWI
jgi:hypothetical protein